MKVLLEEMAKPFLIRIIEEDKDAITKRLDGIWATKKDEIVLDGFRKGKVPQAIAEKTLGFQTLYKDYIDELILKALNRLSLESEVTVVDIQQVVPEKLDKNGIIMQAVGYLKPEVLELDYTNLEVKKLSDSPTSKEIEDQILLLQEQTSSLEPVNDRGVEWNDHLTISFVGSLDGVPFQGGSASNHQVQLLKTSFIPGFGEKILGLKKNESISFPIKFPENYHAANLAGKDTVFDLTVHEIKTKKTLDSKLLLASHFGFETEEDFVDEVAKSLENKKREHNQSKTETEIVLKLLERAKIAPIPSSMVHKRVGQILASEAAKANLTTEEYLKKRNLDEGTFEHLNYHIALRDLKVQLILDYIAIKEKFLVSEEERETFLSEESKKVGYSVEQLKRAYSSEQLDIQIKLRKSYDFLLERANYLEGTSDEGN